MMKLTINASQFTSRYIQTTTPMSAIVEAILTNSPMKNAIGSVPPGLRAAMNKRTANKALGTTQHRPPNSAEIAADTPPISAAISVTSIVTANCIKTICAIFTPALTTNAVIPAYF